ncbi:MAG TPA: thioesterase, partial [Blastocatellia bacterium]|nr:thioesterase [Blastocatellia bacterium]
LGGDSLLGIRLFAQIENECGIHVPLATLLQASTVEQLAGILRAKDSAFQPSLVLI